jgi:capsular polysaccharide biosynthesis protein
MVVPACIAIGVVGGQAVYERQERVYEAHSSVLVLPVLDPTASSGGGSSDEVAIETEAQLLQSAQVAADAAEKLGGRLTAEALLAGSAVAIPANSQVLTVTFQHPSPEVARDASVALAEAYVARRDELAVAARASVVSSLEDQSATLGARLEDTTAALGATPETAIAQVALLESQRDLVVEQMSDINSRLIALRVQPTSGGQLISAAGQPGRPVSPVLAVNVGAGLLLGALAGGGLLLLLRRQRAGSHASQGRVEVPVVELGPMADAVSFRDRDAVSAVADAVGSTRPGEGPVVIVEARSGAPAPDGIALTVALAQALVTQPSEGLAVLPRAGSHPSLAPSVTVQPGLSDVILGQTSVQDAVVRPTGAAPMLGPGWRDLPDDALASGGRLAAVWTLLGGQFDAVVVHAGSDDVLADAILRSAGRIVTVVPHRDAVEARASHVLARLERLTVAERLSCIVVAAPPASVPGPVADRGALDDEERVAEVTGERV